MNQKTGKNIEEAPFLISTLNGKRYPLDRIEELSDDGEPLEVQIPGIENAERKEGNYVWQRFSDFLPFPEMDSTLHLGEGNTALTKGNEKLQEFTGIKNLFLKNETQNPTWSFKDRGSLTTLYMAKKMGEKITATISSGNMGHSISAYGARAGVKVIVFVPEFAPNEKIQPMLLHGAHVIKVKADDYSMMKKKILSLGVKLNLRIVSGNGPIRIEGYKLTAFEIFEQLNQEAPDYVAVPTSSCGHIRGIYKGFRELYQAGMIQKLPKMIVVQAKNNSPIVTAAKQGKEHIIPFTNFHTIAEAITAGSPAGGDEMLYKIKELGWLAEDVSEKEILLAQQKFAEGGYFLEPATATTLFAVKKLYSARKIEADAKVVLVLTGSGLKDLSIFSHYDYHEIYSNLDKVEADIKQIMSE